MMYIDPLGLSPQNNGNTLLTQIGGGLKMVGGGLEAAAGFAFAGVTAETGVGIALGVAVGLHGVDVAVSGYRTMVGGNQVDSFTSQGLQAAGMSQDWANGFDTGISVVGSAGIGIATRAATQTTSLTINQGGLNLFKSGAPQTSSSQGWTEGSRMLYLPNQGSAQANWAANSSALRTEMNLGKPIYDSYRTVDGAQIPTQGFLNAERYLLESRGWIYNSKTGAYYPPK